MGDKIKKFIAKIINFSKVQGCPFLCKIMSGSAQQGSPHEGSPQQDSPQQDYVTLSLNASLLVTCPCGKLSQTLRELGDKASATLSASLQGHLHCSSCDPNKHGKASLKDVIGWLSRVTRCNDKVVARLANELKGSFDVDSVVGTDFGVAIVESDDVPSLGERAVVSPSINGKAYVLVQGAAVDDLRLDYQAYIKAVHQCSETVLLEAREAAEEQVDICKAQLLSAIGSSVVQEAIGSSVVEEAVEEELRVSESEEGNKKKRGREDEPKKSQPLIPSVEITVVEDKKRIRTKSVAQARDWLRKVLCLSEVELKVAIRDLKKLRSYTRTASSFTVHVQRFDKVHDDIAARLLPEDVQIGPAFCANKVSLAAKTHNVLVLVPKSVSAPRPPLMEEPFVSAPANEINGAAAVGESQSASAVGGDGNLMDMDVDWSEGGLPTTVDGMLDVETLLLNDGVSFLKQ